MSCHATLRYATSHLSFFARLFVEKSVAVLLVGPWLFGPVP